MTTQSTSATVITTSFNIGYPDSKSSACPEFNITATRTPGKKDVFKIMAVVDGKLVEPKGKLAPKLYMSDDLRRCAVADLDKKQKEAEAQVVTIKPAKVPSVGKPSTQKAKQSRAEKAFQGAEAVMAQLSVAHPELANDKEVLTSAINASKVDPEIKLTHQTERMLEIKNDMANIEEALNSVKETKAKAKAESKAKKESKPKAEKAESATTDSAKADVHTPDMFERFNAAVTAGKVTTKEGAIKADSAVFKDSKNGGLYEVTLENKKVWKTNFRRINQYYTIQD